uniref:Uncharacterized protein n=1 Tax=Arundo donax TaxID=35708 RepID=A0A0A9H5X6_ARUDO
MFRSVYVICSAKSSCSLFCPGRVFCDNRHTLRAG